MVRRSVGGATPPSVMVSFKNKSVTLFSCSMYDVDGNGWIDLLEMTKMVRSIYQVLHQIHWILRHSRPSAPQAAR